MNAAIYRRSNKSRRIRVGVPVATALCVLGSTTSAEPVYELLESQNFSRSARERSMSLGKQSGPDLSAKDFFWDGTTLRSPDTDEGVNAINDSGLVVGGQERGFIWDGKTTCPRLLISAGALKRTDGRTLTGSAQ